MTPNGARGNKQKTLRDMGIDFPNRVLTGNRPTFVKNK